MIWRLAASTKVERPQAGGYGCEEAGDWRWPGQGHPWVRVGNAVDNLV